MNPISESVARIARRYDRLAPIYRLTSLLFLLPPRARRAAVEALALSPGESVLEVGCGPGANLARLVEMVGPEGKVYGVDVSPGMLQRAERLVDRHGWSNVELRREDAARLSGPSNLDAILFCLSYAVLPAPRAALDAAWGLLGSGGRLVVMDGALPDNLLGRMLRPSAEMLSRLTVLGDPDNRAWEALQELSPEASVRPLQLGTYCISRAVKP